MEKDTFKTPVVFRKFKEGDIIALFPMEKYNDTSGLIMSYQRIGQHGAADYSCIIMKTLPAKEPEYSGLCHELESLGYNLRIIKKRTKR